jgi:hypothetical protein
MADPKETGAASAAPASGRRPYEPPAVAWEERLEDRPNLIAACAQRPGQDDACNSEPFS